MCFNLINSHKYVSFISLLWTQTQERVQPKRLACWVSESINIIIGWHDFSMWGLQYCHPHLKINDHGVRSTLDCPFQAISLGLFQVALVHVTPFLNHTFHDHDIPLFRLATLSCFTLAFQVIFSHVVPFLSYPLHVSTS